MEQDVQEIRRIFLAVRSSDVKTETIDESGTAALRDDKGSVFLCPKDDQVIVGRMHLGDENGKTSYKYGALSFINDGVSKNYEYKLSDVFYSDYMKESDSSFICLDGALIVGREHIGDENGKTRYAYKKLYARKKSAKNDSDWILCKRYSDERKEVCTKESSGKWAEDLVIIKSGTAVPGPEKSYYAPMYGRSHKGDENKDTTTYFAVMTFPY